MKRIGIIDYGMGNITSVRNAFVALDCDVAILNRPHQITGASHLVLPGVGAFGDAMEALIHRDWVPAMNAAVLEKGMPLLGICLGLQLLATRSNEYGSHDGFGWIPGQVVRLSGGEGRYRVPHVGWNDVAPPENHKSADEAGVSGVFYFVHSYHFVPEDPAVVNGVCDYGEPFVASIRKDNINAVQFHPEKSQQAGLQLLRNFTETA